MMLKENPGILYVGGTDSGRQLTKAAHRRGWHIYHPAETLEALAMHVFYYPDVVVIDRAEYPIMATEVAFHLRTLNDETPILDVTRLELPSLIAQIEAALDDAPARMRFFQL